MVKTNVFYNATFVDTGSTLHEENPFTDEVLANLKSKDLDKQMVVWGNAYRDVGYSFFNEDTSPTSSSFSSFDTEDPMVLPDRSTSKVELDADDSFGFDLGSEKYVTTIRMICHGFMSNSSQAFRNVGDSSTASFRIYYSNDNATWTQVASWHYPTISITKGEVKFTITRTKARYFKLHMFGSFNPTVTQDPFDREFEVYAHKFFLIDTSAGNEFRGKFDLGANYRTPTLYIHSELKRDQDNISIQSSSDDISYNPNSLSFGETWTALTDIPASAEGKLLFYEKQGNLFHVGSGGILDYDFENDTWSVYENTTEYLNYFSYHCAIDQKNGVIYSVGSSGVAAYNIKNKTLKVLPTIPWDIPTDVTGVVFAFDSFLIALNDSGNAGVLSTRFGQVYATYSYLSDRWVISDFRFLTDTYDGLRVYPINITYNNRESVFIPGYNLNNSGFYQLGTSTIVSQFTSTEFDGMYLESTVNARSNQYGFISSGRPMAVWINDVKRNMMVYMVQQHGNVEAEGTQTRRTELVVDLDRNAIYIFPDNNLDSYGQIYHFSGLSTSHNNSVVYVPDTKRFYRTGGFEFSGAYYDFLYYDLEQFVSIHTSLDDNTRYIEIQNTTTSHWPFVVNQIEVIEDSTDAGFGDDVSNYVIRHNYDIEFEATSSVSTVSIFNNKETVTPSGYAFIEPDGSEGSRYFQISNNEVSGWKGHCVYNDLDNFVCTAGSELYDTDMCGICCTTGTAGIAATGYYTTDFVDITALASGINNIYIREKVPVSADAGNKPFDIIAEYYE